MFKTRKGLLAIILIAVFTSGGLQWPGLKNFGFGSDAITVSDARRIHILQGDNRGGGHAFGAGKPCKSEFPKEWSNDEIIAHVEAMAANDNLDWRKQQNGYYTAEDTIESVRVRVVLNQKRDDIITAYPVNLGRNPCPARTPANDNDQ